MNTTQGTGRLRALRRARGSVIRRAASAIAVAALLAVSGCANGSDNSTTESESSAGASAAETSSSYPGEDSSAEQESNRAKLLDAKLQGRLKAIDCRGAADQMVPYPGDMPDGHTSQWKRYDGTKIVAAAFCVSIEGKEKWEIRQYDGDLDQLAEILATPDAPVTDKACTKQFEAQPLLWIANESATVSMPIWPRDECRHLQSPKPEELFTEAHSTLITTQESPDHEVETTDR